MILTCHFPRNSEEQMLTVEMDMPATEASRELSAEQLFNVLESVMLV